MRSFRLFHMLADRMGLTLEDGGQVRELPYAEGITLTTLIDDWTRIRVKPQVLTLGQRKNIVAPGAGLFNVLIFSAEKFPCLITYLEDGGTGAATIIGRRDDFVPAIFSLSGVQIIEGPGPVIGSPSGLPPGQGGLFDAGSSAVNPLSTSGFNITTAASAFGSFLPLLVLPGEKLIFTTANSNTQITMQIAWQQQATVDDAMTSQALQVLGNL